MIIIYKYTNKMNGKEYVGQTNNFIIRQRTHISLANNKPILYLDRAIKKYGINNFDIYILEEIEDALADEREAFWIKEFNTLVPNGYNIRAGGKTQRGFKLSEEHKRKLSVAKKGYIMSKEHKIAISNGNKGKVVSEETKKKISESSLGKIISEEQREKISKTLSGRQQPKPLVEKRAAKMRGKRLLTKQKITDEQLFMILEDDRSSTKIAKDYGVCPETIRKIKLGIRKPNKEKKV